MRYEFGIQGAASCYDHPDGGAVVIADTAPLSRQSL